MIQFHHTTFSRVARAATLALAASAVSQAGMAAPTVEVGTLQVGTDLTYPP